MDVWRVGDQTIYCADFLEVDIPDGVNLIVTSPPYNLGKDYGVRSDELGYGYYLDFTEAWLSKAHRLLAPDGRLCLNIPLDTTRGGMRSVYADIVSLAKRVGFGYRTTIVWDEGNISKRMSWGSWCSARTPHVIAPVEMIGVFYKEQWRRLRPGESDISRDEFLEWTLGLWKFPGENPRRVCHPAPFPVELPYRCIKLFTYVGDVVLDPFVGSGTTLVACERLGRRGVGIEVNEVYCRQAIRRVELEGLVSQPSLPGLEQNARQASDAS